MLTIPFLDHCKIWRVRVSPESAVYAVEAINPLTNSRGTAHGGLLMTLLDITLGQAVLAATVDATSFITIQMNVDFIKPGQGYLEAEGRVLRTGRSISFVEGEVRDKQGNLVAKASAVFKPTFG